MGLYTSTWGNVEVWVESSGRRLDEYAHRWTSPNSEEWHIPSNAAEPFAVCIKPWTIFYYFLRVAVYGDGVHINSRLLDFRCIGSVLRIDSVMESATTERPCVFANLRLTDDDSAARSSFQIEQLGSLRVSICPVVFLGPTWNMRLPGSEGLPGDRVVHERCKKAGGHVVSLGGVRPITYPPSFCAVQPVDGTTSHEMIFNYASIELLRAQGIAPRPAPRQVTPEAPVASTSRPLEKAKKEHASPSNENAPGVKIESEAAMKKKKRKSDVVDIDSSDEDVQGLTEKERVELARLKRKAREARMNKKAKLGSIRSRATSSLVVLSD